MRILLTAVVAGSSALAVPVWSDTGIGRGRAVALGTVAETPRETACTLCHGPNGEGDASGGFPRLAGLDPDYMVKQLQDYASGLRPHDTMSRVARLLTDDQKRDVSLYYATRSATVQGVPSSDKGALRFGASIYNNGIPAKGVPACRTCHEGDDHSGVGHMLHGPVLAGQYANYLMLQLDLWKDGVRRNSPLHFMRMTASQMSAEEMRAVSLYLESLPPPRPYRPGEESGGHSSGAGGD